jgi:hypothetical protein
MTDYKTKSTVHERILRLKHLLEEWSSTGHPQEVDVPRSLNAARVWEAPKYGIVKIGSKRDFTKSHAVWGGSVEEIEKLILDLKPRKPAKAVYRSESSRRLIAQMNARESEILLARVTGQWHEAREQLRLAEEKIGQLETDYRLLLKKNADLEADNAGFRKRLSGLEGPIRLVLTNDT